MAESPTRGRARSQTPLGTNTDPQKASGLKDRSAVYERVTLSEGDHAHLKHLKGNYERTREIYRMHLDLLEEAQAADASKGPERPAKRPVGPRPAGTGPPGAEGGPARPATRPQRQKVAEIAEETARRVTDSGGLIKPVVPGEEPTFDPSGALDKAKLAYLQRNVSYAKQQYEEAVDAYVWWSDAMTKVAATDDAELGGNAQLLGADRVADEAVEAMKEKFRGHAKVVVEMRKSDPGKGSAGQVGQVANALEGLQLAGADDEVEGSELARDLSNYLETGEVQFVPEPQPEEPQAPRRVAVVVGPSTRPPPGCFPNPRIVARGDWLTLIAKDVYGQENMMGGAKAIYRVNRDMIGDDWNQIEVNMVLWIPLRPDPNS
jgi:hypothetical protein